MLPVVDPGGGSPRQLLHQVAVEAQVLQAGQADQGQQLRQPQQVVERQVQQRKVCGTLHDSRRGFTGCAVDRCTGHGDADKADAVLDTIGA